MRRVMFGVGVLVSALAVVFVVRKLNSSVTNAIGDLLVFKNTYILMRHGQSTANVQGVVSSDPAVGSSIHGLSETGRLQVSESSRRVKQLELLKAFPLSKIKIFHSPFLRTKETASILAEMLALDKSQVEQEFDLRERYFGELDGGPTSRYQEVWDEDLKDPDHHVFGVESANAVQHRASAFIKHLESKYSGQLIFIVAHGDTLQILQTACEKVSASAHRTGIENMETAEFRVLKLSSKPKSEL